MPKRNRITINLEKTSELPDVNFISPYGKDKRVRTWALKQLASKYQSVIHDLQRKMVSMELWRLHLHLLPDWVYEVNDEDNKFHFDTWYMKACFTITWDFIKVQKIIESFEDLGWRISKFPEREPGDTELEWEFEHPEIKEHPMWRYDYWYQPEIHLKMIAKDSDEFADDQREEPGNTHCYKVLMKTEEVQETVTKETWDVVCADTMAELSEKVLRAEEELTV